MKHLVLVSIVAVLAIVAGSPAHAAAPIVVAQERCNDRTAGELEAQVAYLRKHPPGDSDLNAGFAALQRLIGELAQEDGVLEATCATQNLNDLRGELRASEALAYLLEADLAMRKFAKCPHAAEGVSGGFVAEAWLELQRATPENGAPPASATALLGEAKRRAARANLTLPALSDASSYWVHQVQEAGKQTVATCPE